MQQTPFLGAIIRCCGKCVGGASLVVLQYSISCSAYHLTVGALFKRSAVFGVAPRAHIVTALWYCSSIYNSREGPGTFFVVIRELSFPLLPLQESPLSLKKEYFFRLVCAWRVPCRLFFFYQVVTCASILCGTSRCLLKRPAIFRFSPRVHIITAWWYRSSSFSIPGRVQALT